MRSIKPIADRVYENIPLILPTEIATVMIANLTLKDLPMSNIAGVRSKKLVENKRIKMIHFSTM